jgi:hypothetical protein
MAVAGRGIGWQDCEWRRMQWESGEWEVAGEKEVQQAVRRSCDGLSYTRRDPSSIRAQSGVGNQVEGAWGNQMRKSDGQTEMRAYHSSGHRHPEAIAIMLSVNKTGAISIADEGLRDFVGIRWTAHRHSCSASGKSAGTRIDCVRGEGRRHLDYLGLNMHVQTQRCLMEIGPRIGCEEASTTMFASCQNAPYGVLRSIPVFSVRAMR